MIEDDIYRSSTQYKLWSFTPQRLAELRQETNELASEKVKAAFRRARGVRNGNGNGYTDGSGVEDMGGRDGDGGGEAQIETLTVDEELKIVEWGCGKIIEMGEAMRPKVPGGVVATAIQYLRRFYLTNSPMTYHPKSIVLCCLFLACKADHFFLSLRRFIDGVDPDGEGGVTEEDVKAPEFLLLQGLRFTLEVRHPFRGLQGGVADMGRMSVEGGLRGVEGGLGRVGRVADRVKGLLKGAAQMTDVYFLFTPSQIWLGGLWVVDEELGGKYLEGKFEELGGEGEMVREKVWVTVGRCADYLRAYRSPEDDKARRREINRIGKKLIACQNPEKADIVAATRAKAADKREGSESEADRKTKKRKLERERAERDGDVFGPDLKSVG